MKEIGQSLVLTTHKVIRVHERNTVVGNYTAELFACKQRKQAITFPKLHDESILFAVAHYLFSLNSSPSQMTSHSQPLITSAINIACQTKLSKTIAAPTAWASLIVF